MTRKRRSSLEGQLVTLEHVSKVLEDNALGDPHVRPLNVWLPTTYHQGRGNKRFPGLFDRVG